MVTSSIGPEKKKAIEAGADDFIPKPFNHDELLVRVKSLLRIKRYHDTIKAQAAELLELNRTLEERVEQQVAELERLRRLRRFLSPQIADAIVSSGDESILREPPAPGRRLLLRPARLHELRRQRRAGGADGRARRVPRGDRTPRRSSSTRPSGFLDGDGVELFFNDPIEIDDPALRAVRLGVRASRGDGGAASSWLKRGYELDFGVGIAFGYATLGEIGFEGRSDYAAVGAVTILASRLCDEATGGQILISQRTLAEVEDEVEAEEVGTFTLKGFARPVPAYNVLELRS